MARAPVLWDLPVRLFHWSLAALVVFSYITAKVGGTWMDWHLRSGYAILALLLFRVAWGAVGSSTARFSTFVRGPRIVLSYLRETSAGRRPDVVGHNPAGGWMVVLMIVALLVQAATGLFSDDEIATQGPLAVKVSNAAVSRMSTIHSWNEWVLVTFVVLHVVAIVVYHRVLRVNLVGPMLHGRGLPGIELAAPRNAGIAAVLFAIACGAVYWLVVVYPRSGAA
jgi:cytochrome b